MVMMNLLVEMRAALYPTTGAREPAKNVARDLPAW
jgi:hypothetical protein